MKAKRLSMEQVEQIINVLKGNTFRTCGKVAEHMRTLGIKVSSRTVSEINRGTYYPIVWVQYPISKNCLKKPRSVCSVCNTPSWAFWSDGEEYCKRHYMQLYHHGKILNYRTIFERNEFVDMGEYFEIILVDKLGEPTGRTKVDAVDVETLLPIKWYTCRSQGNKLYAHGTLPGGKKVRLNRFLLKAAPGMVVDHINGDSLDNRRDNLREVSALDNHRNITPWKVNGVKKYDTKRSGTKYRATITVMYKTVCLGTFDTCEEAVKARLDGESLYFNKSQK